MPISITPALNLLADLDAFLCCSLLMSQLMRAFKRLLTLCSHMTLIYSELWLEQELQAEISSEILGLPLQSKPSSLAVASETSK